MTGSIEVYVRLLDEGTPVFRPTRASRLGDGRVRLLAPDTYDAETARWEFPPGTVVRLETRKLSGGEAEVAISAGER